MLQIILDFIFYSLLSLDKTSHYVEIFYFFVYDTIKIVLLLFFMITIVGAVRTYIPPNKVKKWLKNNKKQGIGYVAASLFGALTPFCSCSSIPLFLGFIRAGIPLGITFSFLITSPIVNEYLVILMADYFGWKVTIVYVVLGILIGVFAGLLINKLKLEKYIENDFKVKENKDSKKSFPSLKSRIIYGVDEAKDIVKKTYKWIIVGVALGALIHNFVPEQFFNNPFLKSNFLSVPLAVLLGIPMYGSCIAIVPIAVVLFQKGLPIGTALAFMMSISALSLPEGIILRRALKLKLIITFYSIVGAAIIIVGIFLNIFQNYLI